MLWNEKEVVYFYVLWNCFGFLQSSELYDKFEPQLIVFLMVWAPCGSHFNVPSSSSSSSTALIVWCVGLSNIHVSWEARCLSQWLVTRSASYSEGFLQVFLFSLAKTKRLLRKFELRRRLQLFGTTAQGDSFRLRLRDWRWSDMDVCDHVTLLTDFIHVFLM